jgi:hypothetical protein
MQIGCFAISSATLGFAALSPTYAQPASAAVLFLGALPRGSVCSGDLIVRAAAGRFEALLIGATVCYIPVASKSSYG